MKKEFIVSFSFCVNCSSSFYTEAASEEEAIAHAIIYLKSRYHDLVIDGCRKAVATEFAYH